MREQSQSEKRTDLSSRKDSFETIILFFSVALVILLYWRWFLPGAITWGDWCYYSKGSLSDTFAGLWAGGLGGYQIGGGPVGPLVMLSGLLFHIFNWSFSIIERLIYFFPLILYLIFSPWYLARILGYRRIGIAAMIIIFNLNTYIFLIAAVTTMALAVAFGPFVLATFIRVVRTPRIRGALLFALAITIQMIYDMRIAYVFVWLCGLYFVYSVITSSFKGNFNLWRICKVLLLAVAVVFLFHSYWILPVLYSNFLGITASVLPEGSTGAGWVRTLSYWNLLHVLGLQLPWWGGKGIVNPPSPQFLLLSIIAFSVFLIPISKRKRKQEIIFFGLAALVFSFLAKGSKPPFGEVYIWLFQHFPGFIMFREPGKWWSPLILSYAVLIGGLADHLIARKSINRFLNWVKRRLNISSRLAKVSLIVAAIILFFVIFPVQPINTLRYSANFVPYPVPEESNHLELFLHSKPNLFRTLWLPFQYRFGYSSNLHPALDGVYLGQAMLSSLRTGDSRYPSFIFSYLSNSSSTWILGLFSIRYVIVPSVPADSPNAIYYWYGLPPEYYHNLLEEIDGINPVDFKGKSKIYEVPDSLPLLYVPSDSIAVIGEDICFFPAIARAEMLKNASLFFSMDQISEKTVKNINGSIFWETNWWDLAVGLCQKIEVRESPQAPLGQGDRQKAEFKVEKAGDYEIYMDVENLTGPILDIGIEIDGKETLLVTSYQLQVSSQRYIKLGEMGFEAGKHEAKYKNKIQNLKIILVRREERKKKEELIRGITRLGNKYYSLRKVSKSGEFYIPQESDYIIKAKVSPCLFRKKKPIGVEFRFDGEKEIKKWSLRPLRVTFDYSINENRELVISSYFDGDSTEDEFVHMSNKKVKVDLEKYPYFDLTYRIEDPEIQTIEIVAGIDFDRDGKVNEHIRGIYPKPVSIFWADFSYDLLSKAKAKFPDEKYYELVHLELYPHKLWRVDCSSSEKKGEYRFWIKNLKFYNYSQKEFLQVIKDALDLDLNSEDEIKNWSIESRDEARIVEIGGKKEITLPKFLTYFQMSRSIDKIDLRQFPMIELDCKVKDARLQNIEFILGLDFDGDTVVDKNIFLDYLRTSKNWEKFQFDAYEIIKNFYPDEKKYNLMQIKLGLKKFIRSKEDYPLFLKRLRIYSYSLVSPVDVIFHRPMFIVDGEKFGIKVKIKDKKDTENLWFEEIVHLKKGKHYLGKLEDDSFKVDWLVTESDGASRRQTLPKDRSTGQVVPSQKPKIIFKKINRTKYEVKVNKAGEPFWLVFNESFHRQWKLYLTHPVKPLRANGTDSPKSKAHSQFDDIVAEYPKLGVKEAKHIMKFTPRDIKYLFRKPLDAEHCSANKYANGWLIDPQGMNLPEDFSLVIFFLPQALFYLGLLISGFTFAGCIMYLGYGWRKI